MFVFHCLQVRDERNFGASLSACPKLEMFNCYKLWGMGGTLHELRLPECKEISLYSALVLPLLQLFTKLCGQRQQGRTAAATNTT
jgi:hypothetical protein